MQTNPKSNQTNHAPHTINLMPDGLRAACRYLSLRQLQRHLQVDLGIDDVPSTLTQAVNRAACLASQGEERLHFQWKVVGRKLSGRQLSDVASSLGLDVTTGTKDKLLASLLAHDLKSLPAADARPTRAARIRLTSLSSSLLNARLKKGRLKTAQLKHNKPTSAASAGAPAEGAKVPKKLIKHAVKSVLRAEGIGQSMAAIRLAASALLRTECNGSRFYAIVHNTVQKALRRRRHAAETDAAAALPRPVFIPNSSDGGLSGA